jgi:hypothetical protein
VTSEPEKANLFVKAVLRILFVFVVDGNLKSPFDGKRISWVLSSNLDEIG